MVSVTGILNALRGHQPRGATTASERARYLLETHLTPAQLLSWKTRDYFWVEGGSRRGFFLRKSARRYVLHKHGIFLPPMTGFCIQGYDFDENRVRQGVPFEDTLLACMLLIRYDEAEFLRIANKTCRATEFAN